MQKKIKLRVSSSIEPFENKALKTWGIEKKKKGDHRSPAVFFGLYHWGDWMSFATHFGKRYVLWAGSDILSVRANKLAQLIIRVKGADHYCENDLEKDELKEIGIEAKIRPSFLEDVNDFPISFEKSKPLKVFISGRPKREKEYGFELIEVVAKKFPEVEFHVYGSNIKLKGSNIIEHGIVSNEQFNKDIKEYHAGIRPNEHDGFSEVLAKSVLMGQYPISRIEYPYISQYKDEIDLTLLIKWVKSRSEPNYQARKYYLKNLNNYPWNTKK